MGCVNSRQVKMTKQLHKDLVQLFDSLDSRASRRLSTSDVDNYWTGPFTKTYTQVLFKEIDLNADGTITQNQWIAYWELALRAGYSESDIRSTMKTIQDGRLQMQYSRIRDYQPSKNKATLVQHIINQLQQDY